MLVRAQRYGEDYRPTKGKYHWMAKPWLTACGREVNDEWDLIPGETSRGDIEPNGCSVCGLAGVLVEVGEDNDETLTPIGSDKCDLTEVGEDNDE